MLTVGDIDKALGGVSSSARMERIKDYHKRGMLPVLGSKNPGTGRAVLFSNDAFEIVATLELFKKLGLRYQGKKAFVKMVASDPDLLMALRDLVEAKEICER